MSVWPTFKFIFAVWKSSSSGQKLQHSYIHPLYLRLLTQQLERFYFQVSCFDKILSTVSMQFPISLAFFPLKTSTLIVYIPRHINKIYLTNIFSNLLCQWILNNYILIWPCKFLIYFYWSVSTHLLWALYIWF